MGTAVAVLPYAGLIPVAAIVAVLLVAHPVLRLPTVVVGGLVTLSNTPNLNVNKLVYLGIVVVASCGALVSLFRRSDAAFQLARPLLISSAIFAVVVVLSGMAAVAGGRPVEDFLRDAVSYLLFAAAPILALDWMAEGSQEQRIAFLLVVGVLAAASYTLAWIARRHLGELPLATLLAPSSLLACALVSFATSKALLGRHLNLLWAAIGAAVAVLLIASASRTLLLVGLAPVAIVMGSMAGVVAHPKRLVTFLLVVFTALVVGAYFISSFGFVDSGQVLARLQSTFGLLDPSAFDPTYQGRLILIRDAWSVFVSHPVFGAGPGYVFAAQQIGAPVVDTTTVDTGLSFMAKFGLAGLAALGALLSAYVLVGKRLQQQSKSPVSLAALTGFGAIAVAWTFVANPFDDKGLSFGLAILLAIALAEYRPALSRPTWHLDEHR